MQKIVRVTGKGQISVPPDRICLLFELEERKDTYREAIKASKESVDELRNYKEKIVKKGRAGIDFYRWRCEECGNVFTTIKKSIYSSFCQHVLLTNIYKLFNL